MSTRRYNILGLTLVICFATLASPAMAAPGPEGASAVYDGQLTFGPELNDEHSLIAQSDVSEPPEVEVMEGAVHNEIDNENQIDRPDELDQAASRPHEKSADDLAKELSNPNSPLASLTVKQIYTGFDGSLPGAGDQASNVTLFQPVFPFPLGDDGTTNLFVRPALAYIWQQPVFDAAEGTFHDASGMADIGFDVAVGRSFDTGVVLVGGMQGTIPVRNDVSGDQWRLGPEFVVAKLSKKGYWALFPSHQWDISGDYNYSTSGLEVFGGFYLPNAWTVFTDSKLTYDWVNNQATIPINLSVSKVMMFGKLPVKLQLGVDYFVKSNNSFGQDWAVTFGFTPVIPNFIYDAMKK